MKQKKEWVLNPINFKDYMAWLLGILFFGYILHANLFSQLILTEIMFDADTLEHHNEFIEIYNGDSLVVNLQDWQIGDSLETDFIIDAGENLLLYPGQHGIILDGSYFGNSTTYDTLIPQEALIITIDDGSFGQYGLSNTTPEAVILLNSDNDTIQVYRYSIDNSPGFSDEKIQLSGDNSRANWRNSMNFRGTPGKMNSVTPLEWDVSLDSVWFDPQFPTEYSPFTVYFIIRNAGINIIQELDVKLFNDLNHNKTSDPNEIIEENNITINLSYNDTLIFDITVEGQTAGDYELGVLLEMADDQNFSNNLYMISIKVEPLESPVIINEILYRPTAGFAEWIELYNRGNISVNLRDWLFADSRDTVKITDNSKLLDKDSYLIICGDSLVIQQYSVDREQVVVVGSFPTLNNDFDDLKVFSSSGRMVERINYSSSWMGRDTETGTSLERINPSLSANISENWGASVSQTGSSPNQRNSIYVTKQESNTTISVSPNPFSPDGDGFEDFTIFEYKLPVTTGYISAQIFDIAGRKIRQLVDYKAVAQSGTFVWDGMDESNRYARIGIYIVLFRIFKSDGNLFKEMKSTVVLVKN